jgi:release factor glutamine methyltransferase
MERNSMAACYQFLWLALRVTVQLATDLSAQAEDSVVVTAEVVTAAEMIVETTVVETTAADTETAINYGNVRSAYPLSKKMPDTVGHFLFCYTACMTDTDSLLQDKYGGDKNAVDTAEFKADVERLASGEPLAYVIGWIPFLNLKICLGTPDETRTLIPRPETEWWTEKLIEHLKYKFEEKPFTLLDLCAGSGAIGLAVLAAFPNARVSFGEIEPNLESLIEKNIYENNLDGSRTDIRIGDLFASFGNERFDIIATNPPYIPDASKPKLETSVTDFEPHNALFAGPDGLSIIKQIISKAPQHLSEDGELWMECDISNIEEAEKLAVGTGKFETTINADQYGRLRYLILKQSD